MLKINYYAVGLCAVINMILGALWHSPLLFGELWARLMNLDLNKMKADKNVQKQAQKGYLIATICHLIKATVLAYIIEYTHAASSWFDGLKLGFIFWLGFTLTTMLPNQFFSRPNFSWLLAIITIAYPMVSLSIDGAILAAWH